MADSHLPKQDTWKITNVRIVSESGVINRGELIVKGDTIAAVIHEEPSAHREINTIDGQGGWLVPGFVDIHVHGGVGHQFMEADTQALRSIARFHSEHGTTAMLATTVTAPLAELEDVLACVHRYRQTPQPYAQIVGVHLEGPFLNAKRPGAQNPRYFLPPDTSVLKRWLCDYPDTLRLVTLAPELHGADAVISMLSEAGVVPACGHTDATYEDVIAAVPLGLSHAVHTFNAMRALHHREPGTVGAVLTDDRISAEVIADGLHVHPACIRMLHRLKGDRLILVTDAIAAAGLGDGTCQLGELDVVVKDGAARLRENGALAGSTLTMLDAFQYVVRVAKVPVEAASHMASTSPAKVAGIDSVCGSIKVGKRADLIWLDSDLNLKRVWIGGRELGKSSS